jgi:hypothetical protein
MPAAKRVQELHPLFGQHIGDEHPAVRFIRVNLHADLLCEPGGLNVKKDFGTQRNAEKR